MEWRTLGKASTAVGVILAAAFALEGGYVNDPKDPGGETNHGITKAVAVQNGYTGPMLKMPKSVAEDIYVERYLVDPGFIAVVEISPAVAHKLTDAGINAGTSRASKWFQESLNDVNRGGRDYPSVVTDGKIGPATLAAYQGLERKRGKAEACRMIIKLVDAKQTAHYTSLKNLYDFTPGWIINRIGNVPLTKCTLKPEEYK